MVLHVVTVPTFDKQVQGHRSNMQMCGSHRQHCFVTERQCLIAGAVQVLAQLLGAKPLPWEELQEGDRRLLGAFRPPLLQLLQREPSRRASLDSFHRHCMAIFADGRSTETWFA